MKQIPKFRAWHKEYKVTAPVLGLDFICSQAFVDVALHKDGRGEPIKHKWDISKLELMQWSGCVDIKGIDIFENDIVLIQGAVFQVLYRHGYFCIVTKPFQNVVKEELLHFFDCEVIGNIYGHPHLLETKRNKNA